jgi:hypothetical protein
VKKTRRIIPTTEAMNSAAAQWCIWRITKPPRMSKMMSIVDANAADTRRAAASPPASGRRHPSEAPLDRSGPVRSL